MSRQAHTADPLPTADVSTGAMDVLEAITEVPVAAGDVVHGSGEWGADDLRADDYAEREFFVSGIAGGLAFRTRVLLREPRETKNFSGVVVVEPMHYAGGRSAWPVLRDELIRSGHAWAEVASQASAVARLQATDARRYAEVQIFDAARDTPRQEASIGKDAASGRTFAEVRAESSQFRERWFLSSPQSPRILALVAQACRRGEIVGANARQLILAGLSQTGGVVRNIVESHHEELSRADIAFDGYLAMCSGGDALPDVGVPVMEILAESEMEELRVANLLPGQVRGYTHRRPDSPTFRLYEVAGMSHNDSRARPPRKVSELPPGARWSRFPTHHITGALFAALVRWVEDGESPPVGRVFDLDADGHLSRDEHGNVRGGLRSAYTDLPTCTVSAIATSGPSWGNGYEIPFDTATLLRLYGSEQKHFELVKRDLEVRVAQGEYVLADAERYLRDTGWTETP